VSNIIGLSGFITFSVLLLVGCRCGGAWSPVGAWKIVESESGYIDPTIGELRLAPSQVGGELRFEASGRAFYRWPASDPYLEPIPTLFILRLRDSLISGSSAAVDRSAHWIRTDRGVTVTGPAGGIWAYDRAGPNRLIWRSHRDTITLVEVWERSD